MLSLVSRRYPCPVKRDGGSPTEDTASQKIAHILTSLLPEVSGLVALISHDLRQPLTAILANAEFLTESDLSQMQRNDFYGEICLAIDRMNELISSLLECSKDREALRPAAGNLVDTIARAIRMTSVRREFRRIAIEHRHRGAAEGWFYSKGLERVVANLILNACEAVSSDSGKIVITTTETGACLQIDFWDNGPGIPPTIRESVFQPFVSYGKAEGSGLGLAIAKKIVEEHMAAISTSMGDARLELYSRSRSPSPIRTDGLHHDFVH
jgi:signal transduction histidine kinase